MPTGLSGSPVSSGLDVGPSVAQAERLRTERLRAVSSVANRSGSDLRVGVISNGKAHRNLVRGGAGPGPVLPPAWSAPRTHDELSETLAGFAARKVNLLIVDGGDGTVRDVITAARPLFPGGLPPLALIPSGKTNALALDLGVPTNWTIAAALEAVRAGRRQQRTPIEIFRRGAVDPEVRGFLFGAGGFVRATRLAQGVHRLGAFNSLGVGISLASAIGQSLFGGRSNAWRRGERMRIETPDGHVVDQPFYLVLGSTLQRLPLGLKPFGRPRPGMKLLTVDAPPRKLLAAAPAILAGSEADWLDRAGYHHVVADHLRLSLNDGFILDGEFHPGGDLTVSRGDALTFVTP